MTKNKSIFQTNILTGTCLDTSGPKVKLPVWVGFGLKGDRVIDGWLRTVLFTHATVIKVTACLQDRNKETD